MSDNANIAKPRVKGEFTGYHMLAVLFLFFGTILSVNLTLAYFANSTWTGLVVKNSYVASQSFDKNTAELKKQMELGWQAVPVYSDGVFMIELNDKDGNAVHHASVTAAIGRTTHEDEDRTLELVPGAGAMYQAPTELHPGIWEVTINAEAPGPANEPQKWYGKYRFMVK